MPYLSAVKLFNLNSNKAMILIMIVKSQNIGLWISRAKIIFGPGHINPHYHYPENFKIFEYLICSQQTFPYGETSCCKAKTRSPSLSFLSCRKRILVIGKPMGWRGRAYRKEQNRTIWEQINWKNNEIQLDHPNTKWSEDHRMLSNGPPKTYYMHILLSIDYLSLLEES